MVRLTCRSRTAWAATGTYGGTGDPATQACAPWLRVGVDLRGGSDECTAMAETTVVGGGTAAPEATA